MEVSFWKNFLDVRTVSREGFPGTVLVVRDLEVVRQEPRSEVHEEVLPVTTPLDDLVSI